MSVSTEDSLCGVWISPEGSAHLAWRAKDGSRREESGAFSPFLWSSSGIDWKESGAREVEGLSGEGEYSQLVQFSDLPRFRDAVRQHGKAGAIDWIRMMEGQYLMAGRLRLFAHMGFSQLRRLQLDIETACEVEGGFSSPARKEDRILAIGLRMGDHTELLELEERSDEGEGQLLAKFNARIQSLDPDVVEGHNIFKFDLDYLRRRLKRLRLAPAWGRFGQEACFRNTRLRVAERWIDYPRCDIPGRTVVDTYLLILMHDVSNRELMGYGLKEVARHLGVTPADGGARTYLAGADIQKRFEDDRAAFRAYLVDDLRETEGVAARLLPTYFEQAKAFPTTLQEACLRGTASKVDLVFQEEYFHARAACPAPGEARPFEGGYAASFEEGVFQRVLHFDVASLYPSILLMIGRNPSRDYLGVFIPMLERLRTYRLEYKRRARESVDPALAAEYQARQGSFKILINSFYGYLGFAGARFGDVELAAEVTARGREILQGLIAFFEAVGCRPLEADTDGIYVEAGDRYEDAESLLDQAQATLPEGIELEFDGRYESMFCYKAKNYALYDGSKVTIRGSALRSRGIEPYLKDLTASLIRSLLGAEDLDVAALLSGVKARIEAGEMPVEQLAKSEVLSQSPDAYRKKIDAGGKPRRASLEVALKMEQTRRMGDRVSYYIGVKQVGQRADWQRACPVERYEQRQRPYDPAYYLKKLEDWRKRYEQFCDSLKHGGDQGELF